MERLFWVLLRYEVLALMGFVLGILGNCAWYLSQ